MKKLFPLLLGTTFFASCIDPVKPDFRPFDQEIENKHNLNPNWDTHRSLWKNHSAGDTVYAELCFGNLTDNNASYWMPVNTDLAELMQYKDTTLLLSDRSGNPKLHRYRRGIFLGLKDE